MNRLKFLLSTLLTITIIFSCSKEDKRNETNTKEPLIQTRNGLQGYIEQSPEELTFIRSIENRVNSLNHFDLGVDFEKIVGVPDWNMALAPQGIPWSFESVIVPFIQSNEINAFYYVYDGTALTYDYVDRSLINPPYFAYVGSANQIYEQIFSFYDYVLSGEPFDDGDGFDDDVAEFGGCFVTTTTDMS